MVFSGFNGSHECAPSARIFQESHSGNFEGKTFLGYWGGENTVEGDFEYMSFIKELENSVEYQEIMSGESEEIGDVNDFKSKNGYIYPRKIEAWRAPFKKSDFIQGTFEIFNSSHSHYPVTAFVGDTILFVEPGNSEIVSVNRPKRFIIFAFGKTDGKFCITLYKRILA